MSANQTYSTKKISKELIDAIVAAIEGKSFGSIEIFIQDSKVTQVTERVITKLGTKTNRLRENPSVRS